MTDDWSVMQRQDPPTVGALLRRAGLTLGMGHGELGEVLGASRRSISRWTKEGTSLSREQVVTLAELTHARDPALAAEIAALSQETLVSLGLEAPSPATTSHGSTNVAPSKLVDAVVCAAAEAIDASPRTVRPALLAALRSARELGLTMETLEALLAG